MFRRSRERIRFGFRTMLVWHPACSNFLFVGGGCGKLRRHRRRFSFLPKRNVWEGPTKGFFLF
jgi:hypothetical protein